MQKITQEQLKSLLDELQKKMAKAQKEYQLAQELYQSLFSSSLDDKKYSLSYKEALNTKVTISTEPKKKPTKRRKREDYIPHLLSALNDGEERHYESIRDDIAPAMGEDITAAGVYKVLDRLTQEEGTRFEKGLKRGCFKITQKTSWSYKSSDNANINKKMYYVTANGHD